MNKPTHYPRRLNFEQLGRLQFNCNRGVADGYELDNGSLFLRMRAGSGPDYWLVITDNHESQFGYYCTKNYIAAAEYALTTVCTRDYDTPSAIPTFGVYNADDYSHDDAYRIYCRDRRKPPCFHSESDKRIINVIMKAAYKLFNDLENDYFDADAADDDDEPEEPEEEESDRR